MPEKCLAGGMLEGYLATPKEGTQPLERSRSHYLGIGLRLVCGWSVVGLPLLWR